MDFCNEVTRELWNLMPMDSSLNSSKSNKLPKWDPFFRIFAENQYGMYILIYEKEELHKRFEACHRDNLHSIWAGQELYKYWQYKGRILQYSSEEYAACLRLGKTAGV